MGKKVKVRIAVAVDRNGNWNAAGGDWSISDDHSLEHAVECLDSGENRYILTAELDVPGVKEVAATVEPQPTP